MTTTTDLRGWRTPLPTPIGIEARPATTAPSPAGYDDGYDGDLLSVAAMHTERADGWWRSTADRAVATLARTRRPFTVDDVRDLGVEEPDHPNRWGGLGSPPHERGRREGGVASGP